MNIKDIEFRGSFNEYYLLPDDHLKEIVIAGRSNVGKSSFINSMLNNNKVARVSQTPGKTVMMNFFKINNEFYFVDLPGYGYASVAKDVKESFKTMIETYLIRRTNICLGILLIDFRHEPTSDDVLMYNFLKSKNINTLIVATKLDKVKKNDYQKNLKIIKEKLNISYGDQIIPYSKETKENVEDIWLEIEKYL